MNSEESEEAKASGLSRMHPVQCFDRVSEEGIKTAIKICKSLVQIKKIPHILAQVESG